MAISAAKMDAETTAMPAFSRPTPLTKSQQFAIVSIPSLYATGYSVVRAEPCGNVRPAVQARQIIRIATPGAKRPGPSVRRSRGGNQGGRHAIQIGQDALQVLDLGKVVVDDVGI